MIFAVEQAEQQFYTRRYWKPDGGSCFEIGKLSESKEEELENDLRTAGRRALRFYTIGGCVEDAYEFWGGDLKALLTEGGLCFDSSLSEEEVEEAARALMVDPSPLVRKGGIPTMYPQNSDFSELVLKNVKDSAVKGPGRYGDSIKISVPVGDGEFASFYVGSESISRSDLDGRINIKVPEKVTVYYSNHTKENTDAATLITAYNNARASYAKSKAEAGAFEEEDEELDKE